MKKILSLSLTIWFLIVTILTLPSCYNADDGTGYNADDGTGDTNAANDTATREEITTTAGLTASTETWKLSNYVDEFGLSTGENFIFTTVYDGKFSNSETTNSKLTAVMQVDEDNVMFILYEYGRNQVKCSYKSDQYAITMLDANNKKHYLSGTMHNGSFRIYVADADRSTVLNALKGSGTIRFYVVLSDRITTTYSFSIETSNFRDAYNSLR